MKKQSYKNIFSRFSHLTLKAFVLLVSAVLMLVINISAADPTPTPTPTPAPSVTPAPTPPVLPSLSGVKVVKVTDASNSDKPRAGIGHSIIVTVENLKNLKNYADCLSLDDKPVPGCSKQKIGLFLNGREIKDTYPESINMETKSAYTDNEHPENNRPSEGTADFHLRRSPDSDEAWADLLGNPRVTDLFDKRDVTVSVGLKDSYALGSSFNNFTLARVANMGWFWGAIVFLIILIGSVFYLALYTNLLRDVGVSPDESEKIKGWLFKEKLKRKSYSLARFQMAFWFIFVVGSFIFIWLITGAQDTITTTTLALIGIGAGTALGAAVIDIGKDKDSESGVDRLRKEEKELADEITALKSKAEKPPEGVDLAQIQKDIEKKSAQLKHVQNLIAKFSSEARVTQGFFKDILTDADGGISFHRFQMFVWTIVLGFLFLYSVWSRLSMPEFGGTLIALLGISAGTYLGFKIPENTTDTKP